MSHTKGPWKVVVDRNERPVIMTDDLQCWSVADAWHSPDGMGRANARLLAAAPELLAALLDCVLYMENDDNNWSDASPEYRKAKAAIAKATGGAR